MEQEQQFLTNHPKNLAPAVTSATPRMLAIRQGHSPLVTNMHKAPGTGKPFRGLLLLVNFTDRQFSFGNEQAQAFYDDMMNRENWTGYNDPLYGPQVCTGSVRDYFSDNSNGNYEPQFDVVGPINVNWSQYDVDGVTNTFQLVEAVLAKADQTVDFSQYDADGDGDVDMFYIIYAGYSSSYQGNDVRLIWPHAATMVDPTGEDPDIFYDGVRMARFACSAEIYGWEEYDDKMLDGIGVICHEFSHVLGFQDHYDTSGGLQEHPNTWDLMSSGCYNGDFNRTPCAYNSYEKHSAGFLSVQDISGLDNAVVQLASTETSTDACIIHSMQPQVHFYMENRQPDKWDAGLPGHGMLVWRVDSVNPDYWSHNMLNVTTRTCFRLVRAYGTQGDMWIGVEDTDFDPFPGTKNVTRLDNEPALANLLSYDRYAAPVMLENITENDGVVSFAVAQDPLSDDRPIDYTLAQKLYVKAERLEGEQWVPVSWTATTGKVTENGTTKNVIFNLLPNTLNIEAEGRDYSNGVFVEYAADADVRSFHINAQRVARYPEQSIWLCNLTDVDQQGVGNTSFHVSRHGVPSLDNPDAILGYCALKPNAFVVTQNSLLDRLVQYRHLTFSDQADAILGDVNGDGLVDISDVNAVINAMLGKGAPDGCDLTGDGVVDITDVNAVINAMLGK